MSGTLIVAGRGSKIIQELEHLVPDHVVKVTAFNEDEHPKPYRYCFAQGTMTGTELSLSGWTKGFAVNVTSVAELCEIALIQDQHARICVIGSASAIFGSRDMGYATSKAALHHYVEHREVGVAQQLVGVAPWIISDAGMTTRRTDGTRLVELAKEHPKKRFIESSEVASVIKWALYDAPLFVTNTVIELHGGRR